MFTMPKLSKLENKNVCSVYLKLRNISDIDGYPLLIVQHQPYSSSEAETLNQTMPSLQTLV